MFQVSLHFRDLLFWVITQRKPAIVTNVSERTQTQRDELLTHTAAESSRSRGFKFTSLYAVNLYRKACFTT
jgi:hypothetical protein